MACFKEHFNCLVFPDFEIGIFSSLMSVALFRAQLGCRPAVLVSSARVRTEFILGAYLLLPLV